MLLTLGGRRHDLATRALVVGVVLDSGVERACRRAEALVAAGADVVEVADEQGDAPVVTAVVACAGVPVCVATSSPDVAADAYRAGAVMGRVSGGTGIAIAAGAVVVASGVEGVAEARRAGVPDDRIVLGVSLDLRKSSPSPAELLDGSGPLAAVGVPLMLSVVHAEGAGREAAAQAVALGSGFRLLRSHDTGAARRVRDTIAAVLEAV